MNAEKTTKTSNKKKVLLVITKSNWGGAQRYVFDLATNLDKEQFDVTVILGGKGRLKEKLNENGIKAITIDNLGRNVNPTDDLKVFISLFKLFLVEKPHIIHLNSSKIGGLGALAARLARVPKIIFTAHGFAFKEERSSSSIVVIKILTWITIFLCHKIIVLSQREVNLVKSWSLVGGKLAVIPNGIKIIKFKSKEEGRSILDVPTDRTQYIFGTIAELHKNKGLTYMIEALANLKEIPYLYYILGEGELREELTLQIKQRGLENKIFLLGHQENINEILPAFDIFVLPSIKEGLPYTLLEAGSAGLPVIASQVGGIPEIIENLKSGLLVPPGRPNEIKHALIYLTNHPEEMKSFGENLKNTVQEKFSLQRMVSQTEELYLKY